MVDKVMHFELTRDNIDYAMSAFPEAEVEAGHDEVPTRNLVSTPRQAFMTAMAPTALQKEALAAAEGKSTFAFFEKPGAGKTKLVLDRAAKLWCEGAIDGLFVLSYATVHEQWVEDEAPDHIHPLIPWRGAYWRSGKKQDETILKPEPGVFRILSMNYEAYARSEKAREFAHRFAESGAIMIAADESQRLKSNDSLIANTACENRYRWPVRVIASGEPTPLGLEDYFKQFYFLDPDIIGTWTIQGFQSRYCRMGGPDNKKVIDYYNQGELHEKMAPYVHVGAPAIDAEKLHEVSRFNLNDRARDVHDQLKETMMTILEDEDGEMQMYRLRNALAVSAKLQEVACGRLTDRDGTVTQLDDGRMKLLKSLLEMNANQKVIIWSQFVADQNAQKEMLGDKAAIFNGSTPKADRRNIVKSFRERDGGLQYILASKKAMGTGLNAQGSCFLNIYYSDSFNAGERWQSEMRTYRMGIDRDVRYIDIIGRRTIDEARLASTRRKRNLSDMSVAEFKHILGLD